MQQPSTTLLSIKEFSLRHSSFTIGSLRHIVFNAETNGFKPCIRRIGRRVLIDEAAFFVCVEQQNSN